MVVIDEPERFVHHDPPAEDHLRRLDSLAGAGVRRKHNRNVELVGQCLDRGDYLAQPFRMVDVLLSVARHDDVLVRFQPEPFEHVRSGDGVAVLVEYLLER